MVTKTLNYTANKSACTFGDKSLMAAPLYKACALRVSHLAGFSLSGGTVAMATVKNALQVTRGPRFPHGYRQIGLKR